MVDSYGDVLHDVTEPNMDDVWQDPRQVAGAVERQRRHVGGCAGGTSEELRVLDDGDEAVIDVFVDHCGSSGPELDEAVAGELALFDLDELLATG